MSFQFRLQAILRVRQHERDVYQQAAQTARQCHADRITEQANQQEDRTSVLNELRNFNEGHSWDIDQVAERQRHAEQLRQSLVMADVAIAEAKSHLQTCLNRLVAADQAVKVLERLMDRQFAEHQILQAKIAANDFDDMATAAYLSAR
jgi:flagellar export protein FliJ